ncbi:MAG: 1-acyl-sn-glycerol-3-phosphate acyltransferase [Armatimonadetes bacterium]|nr:1-acyl-sn-glycerol-3-phosphate acyltransferase [Armatimonadota bacterium]
MPGRWSVSGARAEPPSAARHPIAFRPPRDSRWMIGVVQALTPLILRLGCKIVACEFDEETLARLRSLRGQRVVLCPNHPTGIDPLVVFHLSARLGDRFHYLACKECFRRPLKGWIMQKLGCYSIARGGHDTESFRTTRRLLAAGDQWLVICPEGEACGQNDTLMPFQVGVAQMAFWALEDMAAHGDPPPLYFVPLGIKYAYVRDMSGEIDAGLARLERKLGLPLDRRTDPEGLYRRLRVDGDAVLSMIERRYGIRPEEDATLEARIQSFKELVLARAAAELNVKLHPEQPVLDRVRVLFNAAERLACEAPPASDYGRALHQRRQEEVFGLYDDLWRVLRFVATHDGYVRETMTAERFLEVIGRMEWEVFGQECWRGPRRAMVKAGEPLNLTEHWSDYRARKRETVAAVVGRIEAEVGRLVGELTATTAPVGAGGSTSG